MKKAILALFGALLFAAPAIPVRAENRVVSVTFASVAALTAKNGEKLDAKLFHFGKEAGRRQDRSRASANGFDKSKKAACRWALLAGFLKFQRKARQSGKQVVGVRTYAGDAESSNADQCLCLAGRIVVRSAIKAGYR